MSLWVVNYLFISDSRMIVITFLIIELKSQIIKHHPFLLDKNYKFCI